MKTTNALHINTTTKATILLDIKTSALFKVIIIFHGRMFPIYHMPIYHIRVYTLCMALPFLHLLIIHPRHCTQLTKNNILWCAYSWLKLCKLCKTIDTNLCSHTLNYNLKYCKMYLLFCLQYFLNRHQPSPSQWYGNDELGFSRWKLLGNTMSCCGNWPLNNSIWSCVRMQALFYVTLHGVMFFFL